MRSAVCGREVEVEVERSAMCWAMGSRVTTSRGLGFRVQGSEFRVGLGFRVFGFWFRV